MEAYSLRNENEELAFSIQGKLKPQSPLRGHHSIFRVPNVLRNDYERVYVPRLISIGPLHRGSNLQTMEGIKLWYLHGLLQRDQTRKTGLKHFVEAIRGIEEDCRKSYEEKVDMSSDGFVEMLVVDGCFIIELFRKSSGEVQTEDEDPVFHKSWMRTALINDLLLLENQLPWRVIDRLFDLTRETSTGNDNHTRSRSLPEITLQYFREHSLGMHLLDQDRLIKHPPQVQTLQLDIQHPRANGPSGSKHLLDFIRNSLIGSYGSDDAHEPLWWSPIPSVTELAGSGVMLARGRKNDDMLNITFEDGVLRIPPIRVHKNGESLFRNLVAYEQCETITGVSKYASYAVLLDHLIKSKEDVELLIKRGVIENFVGDDMAWLLNNLSNGIIVYNFSYARLYKDLNKFCGTPWNKWRAQLEVYFRNPLELINLYITVGVVTVLTLIQTVYSILSYNKQQQ
ncbi:UPF0481 protein At3g47200-like [Pyrus communis]|uniref:UPF0481 protein At3g47200-like n=1 Tax=Pyrus communis TaxID=23211 RepID=UPI0035C1DE7A